MPCVLAWIAEGLGGSCACDSERHCRSNAPIVRGLSCLVCLYGVQRGWGGAVHVIQSGTAALALCELSCLVCLHGLQRGWGGAVRVIQSGIAALALCELLCLLCWHGVQGGWGGAVHAGESYKQTGATLGVPAVEPRWVGLVCVWELCETAGVLFLAVWDVPGLLVAVVLRSGLMWFGSVVGFAVRAGYAV